MNTREFIFSTQKIHRIKRHILFWCAAYIFFVVSYPPTGWGSPGLTVDGVVRFYKMVLIRDVFMLVSYMVFSYAFVYFLMPFFWRKKYLQFIFILLLLLTITSLFHYTSMLYVYNPIMKYIGLKAEDNDVILSTSIKLMIGSPSSVTYIFITIKFFKDWQQKQRDNFNLKKENANAELSLLKAQIHPHFLFNTLNNIYSFTLNKSQHAKYLVVKLEGMLHYIIEECEQQLVPLSKEIKLVTDYIELEKVRYGNELKIEVSIVADENRLITPLLMIPFVENSFKHGTSKMLTKPWIKLDIETKENALYFSLSNSKPDAPINANGKNGIGLSNVKKRLALLYPQKHLLQIELTENTFSVNMQIPLEKVAKENVMASL